MELFYSGQWNDHTGEVYVRDGIELSTGRPPGGDLTPGSCSLTFDNRSGRFNPRNTSSDLYGLIGRNTPLRVSMRHAYTSGSLADASDDFSDTVTDSWGSADVGGEWHELGAGGSVLTTDFQKAGGFGTHYVSATNAYRSCRLDDLAVTDFTAAVTFKCPQATGANLEPANFNFRGTSTVLPMLARVEVTTANAVVCRVFSASSTDLGSATVPGLTHAGTGTPLRVKMRAVGRDVFMRVWNPAGAEPSVWHLWVTDTTTAFNVDVTGPVPGYVAVRSGRQTGNTNTTNPQFSYDNFAVAAEVPLFVGEVSSWKPRTAIKGDAWTKVEASGVLRRASQGDDPLDSSARTTIATSDLQFSNLVAYWPLEDGEHALAAASLVDGVAPLRPVGTSQFTAPGTGGAIPPAGLPKFGQGTGPGGSDRVISLTEGGRLDGRINATGDGERDWDVFFTMRHETGAAGASGSEPLLIVCDGTACRWLIDVTATEVTVFISDADDVTIDSIVVPINHYDGAAHTYEVIGQNSGSDVIGALWIDGLDLAGGVSMAGHWVGAVRNVTVNPVEERGENQASAFGHLAVFDGVVAPAEATLIADALHGHPGEASGRRIERLCEENSIPFYSAGDLDDTEPMGAQPIRKLGDLLADCERTDAGVLAEAGTYVGLFYRTRESLYNQDAAVTVDYTGRQIAPGLEPVIDDVDVFNDVTATRADGAYGRAIQTSGPMNINAPADDPQGIGRYRTRIDVEPDDETRCVDLAAWHLARFTVDVTRYPTVTVDLDAAPDLTDAAAAVRPGDVMAIENLEPVTVRNMVSEVRQTIGPDRRLISYSGAPDVPYTGVGVWNDTGSKWDSAYSSTASSFVAGTGTSLSVAIEAGRTLWVTGSGSPQFPIRVRLGTTGVVLTVTAISGASSPQTFTVSATLAQGVAKTIPAGTSVRLADPVKWGM